MADSSRTIMTDAGFALETRVRADETKMQFTRATISTDDHFSDTDDALAKLTELSNIQQDGKVTAVQVINTTTVYVQVDVNQAESKADYQMRSAALYAKDDDGTEVLYGVTVLQDPVFVHKDADGSYLGFGINTTVGRASNVVVVVDPANMVTQQVFESTMKNYYTKAEVDAKFVTDDDFASKLPKNIATTDAANTFAKSQTLAGGATDGAGNAIATTKNVSDGDAETLKSAKEYADTKVSGKADDSTVVHTADMRKPANQVASIDEVNTKQDKLTITPADDSKVVHTADMRKPANQVASIDEVNAKQDKIGYTPADDSKVVHTTDTSNWQKSKVTDDTGMPLLMLGDTDDLSAKLNGLPNGYFTIYCTGKTLNNPSASPKRGIIHITASTRAGSGILFSEDKNAYIITMLLGTVTYTKMADDSKVAHLSGANNFDTVPTVNNNPLLLASSLPSDLARTGQDANFTAKLQQNGQDVALANNTIARNPNTGVVSEPVDFTNLTVNGGKSVATSDDLKSLEASAWRPLTLANSTSGTILFKDNGDGTASLIGSATFTIAKGTTTLTPVITPPTGYTFTSLKWSKGTNNKGVYVTGNMTGVSSGISYIFDTSLSNGDICFLGSYDNTYTVTFSPSELTTLNTAAACNPALVSISKV
ncbi:hypothetical protein ACSOCI_08935 [Levilactobacillus brevis]|uniref:hypothetical protein n=1 Tax=Levilactobacillus brevis TaxID=1580 RepID=UPI003F6393EF